MGVLLPEQEAHGIDGEESKKDPKIERHASCAIYILWGNYGSDYFENIF